MYNEEGSVRPLYEEISGVCAELIKKGRIESFEVIFVNDGSTDNSQKALESLEKSKGNPIKIVEFRKNFDQMKILL